MEIEGAALVIIAIAALLTSVLSAVAGLGGGVILLLVIAQFVAPTTAIPIQGAIQLASNGSRAGLLRRDVDWSVVGWSSLLMLPGSLLGVLVATSLPEDTIRVMLAVFVLVLAWRPSLLKPTPPPGVADDETPTRRPMLLALGASSGFLNSTVGASGPVTSPFLKAVTATHVAFVATAAASQVIAHISKLIAFSADGWRISDHVAVIAIGIVGVIVGTKIGTTLLPKIAARRLDTIFKIVLTSLAIRLLFTAAT
ncbi:MAG: sulfite exporter TauE/SafE family protein [Ilumatobacter sp.]